MKKQIENRDDVAFLVNQFYDKIRADEEIGFYFNEIITDWDAHLEKLRSAQGHAARFAAGARLPASLEELRHHGHHHSSDRDR